MSTSRKINRLQNDKKKNNDQIGEKIQTAIQTWSKWRVYSVLENFVGKGENAGCQHFLYFSLLLLLLLLLLLFKRCLSMDCKLFGLFGKGI